MLDGAPRRRRARPVADAPVDQLLLHAQDLTKGWLLALLEQAPLDDAPAILAADLAREGPRVCDAVVRALADDADLRRLEPGGALEPLIARAGEFAGAAGAEATSRAVDALHAVVWSALRSDLPAPDADLITELAERLARVTELVRSAALRRSTASATAAESAPAAPSPGPAPSSGPALRPVPPAPAAESPPAPRPPAPLTPEPPPAASSGPEPRPADALWVGAVEDEISRSEHAGAPLSLLLVELEDSDRVLTAERPFEARATFGRFAQAVRSAVRRQDILACETEARAWIIARDTARAGANALALRVANAVRDSEPWRGAPLAVSAGVAVLGQDGRDAASLIEAAEEAKFAAAASGLSVVEGDWDDETDEAPNGDRERNGV